MPTFLDTIIAQALVLSFLATAGLTGLIYKIGGNTAGVFFANASVGISFTWFCSFILGTPDFPPEYNNSSILSATACLLILGVLIDFFLFKQKEIYRTIVISIILLIGITITLWMRSGFDLWSVPILLGWCVIAFGLQRINNNANFGSGDSTAILIVTTFGTGVIAWISNIAVDRDLAFGLCAISFGFIIFNFPKPRLNFGYGILLAGSGGIYMLVIRLVEQIPSLIPAFIILGFIFFIDVAAIYVQRNIVQLPLIPNTIKLCTLAVFPLALATVISLVAIEFPIN